MIAAAFTMAHAYQLGAVNGWEWCWWAAFVTAGAICFAGSRSVERRAQLHDATKKACDRNQSCYREHGDEAERLRDLGRYWLFSAGLFWLAAIAVAFT